LNKQSHKLGLKSKQHPYIIPSALRQQKPFKYLASLQKYQNKRMFQRTFHCSSWNCSARIWCNSLRLILKYIYLLFMS